MSKKKSKDPWNRFVSGLLKRKREKRDYGLPKDYILSVANNLWSINPTKEIVYNTLVQFASVIYERAFLRKEDDIAFFKRKQNHRFEKEWGSFKDYLDDLIHEKSNETK
jgi:hypothetical protein